MSTWPLTVEPKNSVQPNCVSGKTWTFGGAVDGASMTTSAQEFG